MYRQCHFHRGDVRYTAWIPARYAKVGRYLELKIDGEWVNGWKVVEVGRRMPLGQVASQAVQYRYHRQRTDI